MTDVDAEYERLKAAGMTCHAPPLVFDDGRIETTYSRDPDGNVVQIQEALDPNHAIAQKQKRIWSARSPVLIEFGPPQDRAFATPIAHMNPVTTL